MRWQRVLNSRLLAVLTELRTSATLVGVCTLFYSMHVLVTTRFALENVIKKNWHFLHLVIKKTFKVMPFGPKNTPAFYTAMMQSLRDGWNILFKEKRHTINL